MDHLTNLKLRELVCELKKSYGKYVSDDTECIKISKEDLEKVNFDSYDGMMSIHAKNDIANYLYIDTKFREFIGYDNSFIIGKSAYSFFNKEDILRISTYHDEITEYNVDKYIFYRIETMNLDNKTQEIWIKTKTIVLDNLIIAYSFPLTINELSTYFKKMKIKNIPIDKVHIKN